MKKYIQNDEERDVLFVFGAGASVTSGAPLQKDILNMIFKSEDEELKSSDIFTQVRDFIQESFHIEEGYPSLESVFGYIEYFISKKESLSGKYTTQKILAIKESLVIIIHYIISKSTPVEKNVYKLFWDKIAKINRNISVVTLNYDTFADEAFDSIYAKYAYIDYCIELMNYSYADEIDSSHWWINPREPVEIFNLEDPKPIKLIKIHGSLNWKYCNCCNQVLLTAWDTAIDIKSSSFKRRAYNEHSIHHPESELFCPLDKKIFETFIVPPSYIKDLNNTIINKLIDEAAIEIRKAKKIVFIGYSFPEADVHIKALFKKNLYRDKDIYVVNTSIDETLKANYHSISKKVNFNECTFESFIDNSLECLLTL